jgi:hypothetical protein
MGVQLWNNCRSVKEVATSHTRINSVLTIRVWSNVVKQSFGCTHHLKDESHINLMTSLTSDLPRCYPSHSLTLYGIQRRNYFRHLFSSRHILYSVLVTSLSQPSLSPDLTGKDNSTVVNAATGCSRVFVTKSYHNSTFCFHTSVPWGARWRNV